MEQPAAKPTQPAAGPLLTEDSEELARAYDQLSASRQFEAGKNLARELGIAAGERVLDVGCGTGLLAEYVAGLTGTTGYVLGIDPLPLRIALAQARARPGLEFRVGSADDLAGVPDRNFDVVLLNAVFHWLPEKAGPLRQFARVLKTGGRLGISTTVKIQPRSSLQEVAAAVLSQPPFKDYKRLNAGLTYRVSEEEMRALLEQAGFVPVSIEVRYSVRMHATPEAVIRFSEASSFGNLLGHLPDALRPAARGAIADGLQAKMTPEGIREERRRLIAIARRR